MKHRLPWNWRQRLEIVYGQDRWGDYSYKLQFRKGTTPRGFPRIIGELTVHTEDNNFVDSAEIVERLQRRGLGTMMYMHALTELGTLTTSYHRASDDAKHLWDKLIKTHKYEIDFWKPSLTIFSNI